MSSPRYSYREEEHSRVLDVQLLEAAQNDTRAEIECVLDLDDLDEVAGIEVLDLGKQLGIPGAACIEPIESGTLRISYDERSDVLYLKLGVGVRAQRQIDAQAAFFLNKKLMLSRIQVVFARRG